MLFAIGYIGKLLAVLAAIVLYSCNTGTDALVKNIEVIRVDTSLTLQQIESAARALREMRSDVFTLKSPLVDSIYNKKVVELLRHAKTSESALILASYESAWASSLRMVVDRDRTSSPLELGHAFRFNGDHNTARSLYTLVFSATDANRKANRYANLAMEYLHIGYIDDALRFAQRADSLFAYSGDNEGRLWSSRLLFMAERDKSPQRAIQSVKRFHRILQGISITSENLARSFQKDAVVTLMTMFHELMVSDTSGNLAKIGFGESFGQFNEVYRSMIRQNRPVWETHSHRYFRNDKVSMPMPIVRHINTFDGDLPFVTSSLATAAGNSLVAVTPVGDYIRIGTTWVHNGSSTWSTKKQKEYPAKVLLEHAVGIQGFVHTVNNSVVVASESEVTHYAATADGKYVASHSRSSPERITSISLYPAWQGAVVVLTQNHVQLRSIPNLVVLDEVALATNSLPDSLSQISRVASEPELYTLRDTLLFVKSQYGTSVLTIDSVTKRFHLLPHAISYDMHARGQFYQAEPATICLIEAINQHDALNINFGLNLARSTHEQRNRRLHLVRSQTLDVCAMVTGDRVDVFDNKADKLYSFIHLPLPFDIDEAQPLIKYFIRRNSYGFTLDVAHGNILRSIDLSGNAVDPTFRYYPAIPAKALMIPPGPLHPTSPIEIAGFPFVFRIIDNAVAGRIAPVVYNKSNTLWDFSSPYGQDIIQSVAMTGEVPSVVITNPLIGRRDTLSVIESNNAATYDMVQHVTITALVIGAIAGGIGFVRRRREARRQLVESIRQQQVEALREDMHDMIGSRLVRIASLARHATHDNNDEVLARIHDMTLVTARSLRNLLSLMAESTMSNAEFYGSIREYVAESCADARLDCTIQVSVDDSIVLDNTERHELLMIISEMLTNTIRHARATHTEFAVHVSKGQALITWSDNGTGIAPSTIRGNGLSNMQRRAARINATVECYTMPDEGTRYTIRVLGTGD